MAKYEVGHSSKDLQIDQESASTGNISLVMSTMLHPGSPETLSWSDLGDWQINQKANLVICSCCSVTHSCPTLCNPMNCSMSVFPVFHHTPELAQTHIYWVSNATQPSHPLSSPISPAINLCKHQGLFKWVSPLHQVAKILEFRLQHQSFQWTFRTDFL